MLGSFLHSIYTNIVGGNEIPVKFPGLLVHANFLANKISKREFFYAFKAYHYTVIDLSIGYQGIQLFYNYDS
jgi:hypothetical protein